MKFSTRILVLSLLLSGSIAAKSQQLWNEAKDKHSAYFTARSAAAIPTKYRLMDLNTAQLKLVQNTIPLAEEGKSTNGVPFSIPMPDGSLLSTLIVEAPMWSDRSVTEVIGLRTYKLINPLTHAIEGRVTIWNDGVDGVIFSGTETYYINPLNSGNTSAHIIYNTKDVPGGNNVVPCGTKADKPAGQDTDLFGKTTAGDCNKRTYRIAVAATGEYTSWAGGVNGAKGYITITMNVVAAAYERDLNVFFTLIDNTAVIFTNAATDPYTTGAASSTMLAENHAALGANLNFDDYDLGIVFTRASGGGIANLNAVCTPTLKGRAAVGANTGTGANPIAGPQGQWFNGAVAHEIGHMFSATHTFSATNSACASNITLSSAWEPGGGSTIMAYSGACAGNSYQTNQDHYFHAGSIAQMQNYITGTSGSCAVAIATTNQPPVVTVPTASYNIPVSTPFLLKLDATDPNPTDVLAYSWEQMNANFSSSTPPLATNTQGPMFRSYPFTTNPTRYFPNMDVITDPFAPGGYEILPSVTRTMNFRGTVRDQSPVGGCTAEANVTVTSSSTAGPFTVTSQGFGTSPWVYNGTNTATITWDVANTNIAPVSCANVDILLSLDGGYTYPVTLATATPNDGSHVITIPNVNTTNARVMVKGSGNIFFNVNGSAFAVQGILPVTLVSFTAEKDKEEVNLNWSTATESNSDRFIVQRSSNGSEFTDDIASVKAAGNSNVEKAYEARDKSPLKKWNYYRIKQLDLDGKFTYSKTAAVYMGEKGGISAVVYPNPVRSTVSVNISSEKSQLLSFDIMDVQGRVISHKSVTVPANESRYSFNLDSYSSGIYMLRIYGENGTFTTLKLVKE